MAPSRRAIWRGTRLGWRLPFRLGGAFGGLMPPLIGLLMQRLGTLALAHYVALTAVTGMGVGVLERR